MRVDSSPLYCDHNATTPLDPAVLQEMLPFFCDQSGNPSSRHSAGRIARAAVAQARERCAATLGCAPREIIFTSGGTESNHSALHAAFNLSSGRHLVISATEHSALRQPAELLERRGYAVTVVPVDAQGVVDPAAIAKSLRSDTALVSIHFANNETGVVQPIVEIGNLCRKRGILFHSDAVQAMGKVPLRLAELPIDYASFSAHKIHGPKGVGALYVNRRAGFVSLFNGGGQESGRRAGTENVPGIVGFGAASELAAHWDRPTLTTVRDRFEAEVQRLLPQAIIHGAQTERLPNTSHLRLPGVEAESLLMYLDQCGIQASAGSACLAGAPEPSHVLLAMGLSREDAAGGLRFSFGPNQSLSDADRAAQSLADAVQCLAPPPHSAPH